MRKIKDDMKSGIKHVMNNGNELEIIEYYNALQVRVVFPSTGYSVITTAGAIRTGWVKDKMSPAVFGFGIIGTDHSPKHPLYASWIWYLRKHHNKGITPPSFLYFSDYVDYKNSIEI